MAKESKKPQVIATTDRKEPTTFFFVIFSLVYEGIATASTHASSESRSVVISALTALRFLVRPEHSGLCIRMLAFVSQRAFLLGIQTETTHDSDSDS